MYFGEAFRVLIANPVRTMLTTLGLIIGVAAVISIEVLGSSMAGAIGQSLGSLADDSFIIFAGSFQGDFQKTAIRLSDLHAIETSVPNVSAALPAEVRSELMRYGHSIGRLGISPDSAHPFANLPLAYGRGLTEADVAGELDVAVLSWKAFKRLFGDTADPTGKSIYAGSRRYLIVGVQSAPKQGALNVNFGGDVFIPYTTFIREYIHGGRISAARFTVQNGDTLPATETAVVNKIRQLRGVGPNVRYQMFDKARFVQGVNGIFGAVTVVVGLIGAVSLLVAGIGVMNIMLVSIAERTREIGTRKAIGARRGQILLQFFIESAVLSSVGCFTGMAIGLLIGGIVNAVFIVNLTGFTVALPYAKSLLITALFAAVVTVAFGSYPAFRAARLDPIEALRYE